MPGNFINEFILLIATIIDFIAIFIIFAAIILIPVRGLFERFDIQRVRRRLALELIFALEFIIAADIIRMVVISDINQLSSLVIVVLVRVVLDWTLKREMI